MARTMVMSTRQIAQRVPELGMQCDEGEMPHPLEGRADRYFLGVGMLETAAINAGGTFAAAIFGGRLGLILAPTDVSQPAHWVSAQLSELRVRTHGSEGLLRKRPAAVQVDAEELTLGLREVAEFFPLRRTAQRGRSTQLVAALAG